MKNAREAREQSQSLSPQNTHNIPLRRPVGLMSQTLYEEAEKLEPTFQIAAKMSARTQELYSPVALLNGVEPSPEALEKAKNVSPMFFKKKTAQDRLWRRLRKRYDDPLNAGDGDYGDDADIFPDLDQVGGGLTRSTLHNIMSPGIGDEESDTGNGYTARSSLNTGRSNLSVVKGTAAAMMSSERRALRQKKVLRKDPLATTLVDVYSSELGDEEW